MTDSRFVELGTPSRTSEMEKSIGLLSAVADPVRWTVLRLLSEGQACVCDLQTRVPVAPNLLSYHLKVLREAGLVTASRRGRWVDYSLVDGAFDLIADALPLSPERAPS